MRKTKLMRESEQVRNLAHTIVNHPALEELLQRLDYKLLNRARFATPAEREEIFRIMDNRDLFFKELQAIVANAKEIEQ
jgi:shikimate kinase